MMNNGEGLQNMQTFMNPSAIALTPDQQETMRDTNSNQDTNMMDPEDETDRPYTDTDLPYRGGL